MLQFAPPITTVRMPTIDFFTVNSELILFIYGLAFFSLGFAIMLEVRQSSRLELARSLKWLAAFGITHAFNEWGDLFIPIQAEHADRLVINLLFVLQLILLAVSFSCLFEFGISVLSPFHKAGWARGVPLVVLSLWGLVIFFVLLPIQPNLDEWYRTANALARYFIGLPAGLLAAYGLRFHAIKRIQPLDVPAIYRTLRVAGVSIGIYALFSGLIPPPVSFFPGNLLNSQTFVNAIGIPVIVFRTLATILIAVSMIRSLEVFSLDAQRRIEALEQQQIMAADHERLARDLHDGAIQKVYTAGLLVESSARLASPETELASRLERAKVVLNDAIADLRHNLTELHLSDAISSSESLRELLTQFSLSPHYNTMVKIEVKINLPDEKMLSSVRAGHVSAIVNEALSNVVRHAGASKVRIQADDLGDRLQIVVNDDGVGFSGAPKLGYGLRNMRDRARLLNGDLRFSESPASFFSGTRGRGTTVTLEFPWND